MLAIGHDIVVIIDIVIGGEKVEIVAAVGVFVRLVVVVIVGRIIGKGVAIRRGRVVFALQQLTGSVVGSALAAATVIVIVIIVVIIVIIAVVVNIRII